MTRMVYLVRRDHIWFGMVGDKVRWSPNVRTLMTELEKLSTGGIAPS